MDRPRAAFDTARLKFAESRHVIRHLPAVPLFLQPPLMSADWIGGGIVALGLLAYLLYALWRAERF